MDQDKEKRQREEEKRRRQKIEKLRAEKRRKRRRKAMMMRGVILLLFCLIVMGAIWGISSLIQNNRGKGGEKKESSNIEEKQMEAFTLDDVLHISLPPLVVDPSRASQQSEEGETGAAEEDSVTVEEFEEILQQLYQQGYMLVNMKDFIRETKDKEGGIVLEKQKVYLPAGKKPLILSQNHVSYNFENMNRGYGSRIVLDAEGKITCEYLQTDGTVVQGDYDMIPCVDRFVETHPDFSHEGARGILGVTGYNGILGYRTDPLLGKSAEAGNIYASYGVFDTAQETEACKKVVEALKTEGWQFASYTYGNISYGADPEIIEQDADKWESQVESIVGETDILLFPYGTDIESRKAYDPEDQRYQILKEKGFRFFCGEDRTQSWVQMGTEYVRQARIPAASLKK